MDEKPVCRLTAYILTPQAHQELEEVWQYIARDSIKHADRVEAAIHRTCELLAISPRIGREIERHRAPGIFFFVISEFQKYLVAYYPDTKPLQILGVVHGARDLSNRFR